MSKWELEKSSDGADADKLLDEGWEPFAVEPETDERYSTIWFRRQAAEATRNEHKLDKNGECPRCWGETTQDGDKDE